MWELRQHFCLEIGSDAYFAWQLFDDHRQLKNHYFVVNVAKDAKTGIVLLAIKRRLRPPSRDERDILLRVYPPATQAWKLFSKGIEGQSVAEKSDEICTIVRAIEANYVER